MLSVMWHPQQGYKPPRASPCVTQAAGVLVLICRPLLSAALVLCLLLLLLQVLR